MFMDFLKSEPTCHKLTSLLKNVICPLGLIYLPCDKSKSKQQMFLLRTRNYLLIDVFTMKNFWRFDTDSILTWTTNCQHELRYVWDSNLFRMWRWTHWVWSKVIHACQYVSDGCTTSASFPWNPNHTPDSSRCTQVQSIPSRGLLHYS